MSHARLALCSALLLALGTPAFAGGSGDEAPAKPRPEAREIHLAITAST